MVEQNSEEKLSSKELLELLLKAGWERRGFNTAVLDMRKAVDWTDYLLILNGRSSRHVKSIAEYIVQKLKEKNIKPYGTEGMEYGRWVVLDYDSVVVHVFLPDLRELYDLEGLWKEHAVALKIEEPEWVRQFEEDEDFEEEDWES